MVDAEELLRLLAPTMLGGRPLEPRGASFVVRIDADEVWPAWQAARSLVSESGRWPLAITSLEDPDELGADLDWSRVERRPAPVVEDPFARFDVHSSWGLSGAAAPASWERLRWNVDRPLSEQELRAFIDRGVAHEVVERAEFDRWIADGTDRSESLAYLTDRARVWFDPAGWHTGLAFLPTDDPAVAGATLSYYGTDAKPSGTLEAVTRSWHTRFGAEPVANWGTMLDFVVTRRPATPDEAWQLAGEMLLVGGSLQCGRVDLAMALLATDFWHLHDRP